MNYSDYLLAVERRLSQDKYQVFKSGEAISQYVLGRNPQSNETPSKEFQNLGLNLFAVSDPKWGYRFFCTIKSSENLTSESLLQCISQIYNFVQLFESNTKEYWAKNEAVQIVFVAPAFPQDLIDTISSSEIQVKHKQGGRTDYLSVAHPVLVELGSERIFSYKKWRTYMWLFWGKVYKWPSKYLNII